MRCAIRGRNVAQLLHGECVIGEVQWQSGKVRAHGESLRQYAWCAVERIEHDAGIVGNCGASSECEEVIRFRECIRAECVEYLDVILCGRSRDAGVVECNYCGL